MAGEQRNPTREMRRTNGKQEADSVKEAYNEMERIISDLVECYAIPHTRMCMRWSRPSLEEYREEVVEWLTDYSKSFVRLPRKALPGREDLQTFARKRLDEEISKIRAGENRPVEQSYSHLFS